MTDGITIDFDDIWELAEDLGATADMTAAEMYSTMLASLTLIETKVIDRTPVNIGMLRGSVAYLIHGRPPNFRGEVYTPIAYGLPVEHGRKAGRMPPPDAIQLWVRRKLGISDAREVRSVAYLIARAIGKRGTKGAHMFEKGLAESERQVYQMWDDIPRRIVDRLANG